VLNRDYPMVQGGLLITTAFSGADQYRSRRVLRVARPADPLRWLKLALDAELSDRRRNIPPGPLSNACCITGCFLLGLILFAIIAIAAALAPWDRSGRPEQTGDALQVPATGRREFIFGTDNFRAASLVVAG